jgi:4-methyl-5(b-hydroxyethyl)-thiazole monophosphate biosynthesis
MSKTVLVPLADGSEDIESVTLIDVLRRAGAQVTVAGANATPQVTCARGVRITCDTTLDAVAGKSFDLIAVPGGMPGAEHLRDHAVLTALLKAQHAAGKPYAAICAAPAVVLATHGLLDGKAATAYPGFDRQLRGAQASTDAVVRDGNVVTSRGPGTALAFALELVELLYGRAKRDEIAAQTLAD